MLLAPPGVPRPWGAGVLCAAPNGRELLLAAGPVSPLSRAEAQERGLPGNVEVLTLSLPCGRCALSPSCTGTFCGAHGQSPSISHRPPAEVWGPEAPLCCPQLGFLGPWAPGVYPEIVLIPVIPVTYAAFRLCLLLSSPGREGEGEGRG